MADKNEEVLNAVENAAVNYTDGDKKSAEKNLQNTTALSNQENKAVASQRVKDWMATADNLISQQEAKKYIDDGYLKNLPKSIVRMYKNGDFGDLSTPEGKKNARNTMGLAIVQTLANTLGNIGNSVAAVGGVNPGFQAQETVADTINKTNLQQGLENKWNKEKQSTQTALDMVKQRGMDEEEAQSAIQKLNSNARMQAQFNHMTADEKVYALEVQRELGEEIGELTDPEAVQLMQGMLASGADPKECALLIGIRYFPKAAGAIYKKITGEEMPEDLASAIPQIGEKVTETAKAGMPKDTSHVVSTPEGDYNVGAWASGKDFKTLSNAATELEQQWYDGKISDEEYLKQYGAIYDEWDKHDLAKKTKGTFAAPEDYLAQMKERKATYDEAKKTKAKEEANLKAAQDELSKAETRKEKSAANKKIKEAQDKIKTAEKTIKKMDAGK